VKREMLVAASKSGRTFSLREGLCGQRQVAVAVTNEAGHALSGHVLGAGSRRQVEAHWPPWWRCGCRLSACGWTPTKSHPRVCVSRHPVVHLDDSQNSRDRGLVVDNMPQVADDTVEGTCRQIRVGRNTSDHLRADNEAAKAIARVQVGGVTRMVEWSWCSQVDGSLKKVFRSA